MSRLCKVLRMHEQEEARKDGNAREDSARTASGFKGTRQRAMVIGKAW